MKYIDADKLLAEIRKELDKEGDEDAYEDGYDAACLRILCLIHSLEQEQPEVDLDAKLEADIEMEVEKMIGTDYFKQLLAKSKFVIDVVLYTARHFYELGRARKK